MSSLRATDDASEAVRKGHRITLDELESRIASVEYIYRDVLTIAVVTLDNGWRQVGHSAAVDPANYNRGLGERFAREDAVRALWPLVAFGWIEARRAEATAVDVIAEQ